MSDQQSGYDKHVVGNPILPAILLAFSGFRIWDGSATWLTFVSAIISVVWIFTAIQSRRSREAEQMSEADAASMTNASTGSVEHARQLREAIETVRRMQRENAEPRPVPTEEEIRGTSKPAIYLHRATLPVPLDHPARSYFGGLPRLPAEFEWPEKEAYGTVALTFLAQIDLAELPAVSKSPLPRSGTLYFFADMNADAPEPDDCRVLYYAGDSGSVPLRDLPATARPYGFGGEPWPWLPAESTWARTSFRFPISFTAFDSLQAFRVPQSSGGLPPARNREVFERLMSIEATRVFGTNTSPPSGDWRVFSEDRNDWPFAWSTIEYGARAIAAAAEHAASYSKNDDAAAAFGHVRERAARWIERAASEVPHAASEIVARDEFVRDWRTLAAELQTLSKRFGVPGRFDEDSARLHVVMASCYACASGGADKLIPETYGAALEGLNDPIGNFPRHQMLGHGEAVQWAPAERVDQVLLLQVKGDDALGWHSNVGGVLQFWIQPDALEQRDFDSVEMTMECD